MAAPPDGLVIEPANPDDLPALGRLGALLMRQHHDFDPERFLPPGRDPESGYAWFLGTQLDKPESLVLVARQGGAVVGYAFAEVEPLDWKALRDAAGLIHDLVVDPAVQRRGIGHALMAHAEAWLRERGVPRVVLWAAARNTDAARRFRASGYRDTMTEMTKEL